jgi:hypothetical protein
MADVKMNINNGNGSPNVAEEKHSLYQSQHEFVNQGIKEDLYLNVASPPSSYWRRRRGRLTEEQTNVLNNIFKNEQKPDATTRALLAQKLDMSARAVQVWFQNRRARFKREKLELKNAAKNNAQKKLTVYCPEKIKQKSYSLSPSPFPNSTKNFSGIMSNPMIALTGTLLPEERIHLNKNVNIDNDEKIGCNVDHWNTSYSKPEEIDGQPHFSSHSLHEQDGCRTDRKSKCFSIFFSLCFIFILQIRIYAIAVFPDNYTY